MKQFLASVNESDYITMRLGFITVVSRAFFILWIEFPSTIKSHDKLMLLVLYIDSLQDQSKIQFPRVSNTCSQFWFQESCRYQVKVSWIFHKNQKYPYCIEYMLMYISNCSWYLWVFVVFFLLLNITGKATDILTCNPSKLSTLFLSPG